MATDSLYAAVDRVLADPADVVIARGLFGCEPSPARIADDIDRLCMRYLGASVECCLYAEFSSGAFFGLVLDHDRTVALKVNDQRFALSKIASVAGIQRKPARNERVPVSRRNQRPGTPRAQCDQLRTVGHIRDSAKRL